MKRKLLMVAAFTFALLATSHSSHAQFTEDFNDITTLVGSGWYMQNNSTTVGSTNWFQGNATVFAAYNGATDDYIGANYNNTTGANTIGNWLVMPNVTIKNGDVISFRTRTFSPETYPDRLELRMSTNGASTNVGPLGNPGALGDFGILLTSVNPALVLGIYPQVWTQYSVTISGLGAPVSGRFALKYYVTNAGPAGANSDYIGIDNVVYTAYVCPTLTVTPGSVSNGTTGVAYNQVLGQTGALGSPTYTVISGSLPTGLTLSAGGTISGTPTAAGTYNFTVQVADNSGCTGSQAYTIVISCPALTILPGVISNPTVGTFYSTNFSGSGGTGPYTFAVTAGSLPVGLGLTVGGVLSGTPTTSGPFGFTVTATDAYGCQVLATYNGNVNCPSMSISPAVLPTISLGVPFNQSLSTAGGTAAYTYTLTSGTLPAGLTLSPGGLISGTPSSAGAYNFTVTSTDAYGCTTSASYNGNVTCPGLTMLPAAMPTGTVAVAYSQNITTSGGSGPYTYAVTSGTLPPGLTLSTSGLVSGTPTLAGNYNFSVTSTDALGCSVVSSYVINIGCPAITLTPPSLPSGNSSVAYNQSMSSSGGTGPYNYSVTAGSLPGGLTLTTGGVLSGTPNALGTFNFSITTTDAGGCSQTIAYTITITCASSFVTLAPFTAVCSNDGLIPLTGGSPAGGTYSGTGVSGGFFNPSVGSQIITYSLTDGQGCSDNDAQAFTVNAAPNVTLSPSDPSPCVNDGAVTLTGGPSGGTYFGSAALTGNLFNPTTAGVGSHPVSYSYTDGNGCSDTATVTIVVNGCAGIEDAFGNNVQLYPNPADEFISVHFTSVEANMNWKLEIYTIEGKLLLAKEINIGSADHVEPINISTFTSGTYLIKIQNNKGGSSTRRFIKK